MRVLRMHCVRLDRPVYVKMDEKKWLPAIPAYSVN